MGYVVKDKVTGQFRRQTPEEMEAKTRPAKPEGKRGIALFRGARNEPTG